MDFFRSFVSDDSPSNNSSESPKDQDPASGSDSNHSFDDPDSNPGQPEEDNQWSFGGFVRTFTTKSESVLETYRRDLEEFRSGLQKETELFKEVASRAGSSAIDGVLKSTAEIVAQGKETLLASYDIDSETPDYQTSRQSFDSGRYNRFEAQLRAIQSDVNSYCEEPDDLDDYSKWKLGFVLEDRSDEIKDLIEENDVVEGMHKRFVPSEVDNLTFWLRYFYRFYKLKQQDDVRASLVKRAISINDDEELTWDFDDDEEEEETNDVETKENQELGNSDSLKSLEGKEDQEVVDKDSAEIKKGNSKVFNVASEKVQDSEVKENEFEQADVKLDSDKADVRNESSTGGAAVDPKMASVSEVDEIGWDEIEDLGVESKVFHNISSSTAELINRLSTAEDDDEDLRWDIEDNDKPVKEEK